GDVGMDVEFDRDLVAALPQLHMQPLRQTVEGVGEKQDAHGVLNRSSQHILGSCSPDSQSTMRPPPKLVDIWTNWWSSATASPMSAASRPSGCAFIAASTASATSGATIATSLPSLATWSGSSPSSSQAAATPGFTGMASSCRRKPRPD